MAKAVISSTYDDKYLFFLPIVTWCWNKLGVDVICFLPQMAKTESERQKYLLTIDTSRFVGNIRTYMFDAPEHKEATYVQCSRLYGACLDLPEDEILVTGDIDLLSFKLPTYISGFTIYGSDLVPQGQYPMCFISAKVKDWRNAFELYGKTYQQCLDETIGKEECENMRGNLWSRDQETAYNKINLTQELNLVSRSNGQNQFAQNRVDRTDTNWRSYLNGNLVDAHLWRPGYTDENFANIIELMTTMYPNDDFAWLVEYRQQYLKWL